jgi:hypothetical protein
MPYYGPWQQPADPVDEFERGYKFTSDIRQRNLENQLRQQQLQAEQNRATAYHQLLQQERERAALTQKAAADRAAAAAQHQAEQDKVVPLPNNEGYTYGGKLYFNKPPAPEYPAEGSAIVNPDTGADIGLYGPKGAMKFFPPAKTPATKSGTVKVPLDETDPKKGSIDISLDDPLYQKWAGLKPNVTTTPATPEIPDTRVMGIPIPFTGKSAQPATSVTNALPSLGTFLQNYQRPSPPIPKIGQENITQDDYAKLKKGDTFWWNGQQVTKQ